MLVTEKEQLREYYSDKRIWQGIPGIERTNGGRLFATWYSGETKETIGNYQLLVKSDNDGKNWSEPIAVAVPPEGARCFDGCLWIDPLKRLWFFYSQSGVTMAVVCDKPDADKLLWSEPKEIADGVMLNKPTVLSSGEWFFPVAKWLNIYRFGAWEKDTEEGSYVYKTSDNGETFSLLGKADVPNRSYDEHMVLEHNDGTLSMYVRTNYGIGVSRSYDRGKTWTVGLDSGLGGPCSRFHIKRLKSGRVLLINHHNFEGRNNLTAFLSEDDGKTFPHKLLLDGRNDVSYPDAAEGDNGFIYIIYDRERGGYKKSKEEVKKCDRAVYMAKITEEDIIFGEIKNPQSSLWQVVNRLEPKELDNINPFGEVKYYTDSEYLNQLLSKDKDKIIETIFNDYGVCCMGMSVNDREKLDKLIDEINESNNIEELLADIIYILRRNNGETQGKENPVVSRIISKINENMREEIHLEKLAQELGISKYYMCHSFKKKVGVSILSYRNSVRLAHAKQMLVSTDIPVLEICEKCGFADSSYFSKIFKAEENMTPSEYRKLHSY